MAQGNRQRARGAVDRAACDWHEGVLAGGGEVGEMMQGTLIQITQQRIDYAKELRPCAGLIEQAIKYAGFETSIVATGFCHIRHRGMQDDTGWLPLPDSVTQWQIENHESRSKNSQPIEFFIAAYLWNGRMVELGLLHQLALNAVHGEKLEESKK